MRSASSVRLGVLMASARSSPRVFDRAALEGVRRWRYRPAQRDGQVVAYGPLEVLLDFNLSDAQR